MQANELLASVGHGLSAEPLLIVDDEPAVLEMIGEMLTDQPYVIYRAGCLAEADRVLKDQEISVVLTDLVLGAESGIDLLVRAQKYQPRAKVVLMTGKPTIQNAISVLKTGAFDYLLKPFDMETLKATLRRATELVKLERENVRLNELMSFYKISEAMSSEIEPDRLLKLILDTAIKEFKADFAALHLLGKDGLIEEQKNVCCDLNIFDDLAKFSGELARDVSYRGKPVIINEPDTPSGPRPKAIRSAICQPLLAKGKIVGTLSIIRTRDVHRFTSGELTTLSLFAAKAAIEIENMQLYQNLENAYFDTVAVLTSAIEARDRYTAGHTERVWKITSGIADSLGWGAERIKELRMGAMLHDIGKIGVPDAILNKPGPLTPEEFAIMKTHPQVGASMIEKITFLNPALPYVLYHHERYDGTGYPVGLRGEDIPIQGRLLAVVDTFDAITSDRPYRRGRTLKDAIEEIVRNSGTQFDPVIVQAFQRTIETIKW